MCEHLLQRTDSVMTITTIEAIVLKDVKMINVQAITIDKLIQIAVTKDRDLRLSSEILMMLSPCQRENLEMLVTISVVKTEIKKVAIDRDRRKGVVLQKRSTTNRHSTYLTSNTPEFQRTRPNTRPNTRSIQQASVSNRGNMPSYQDPLMQQPVVSMTPQPIIPQMMPNSFRQPTNTVYYQPSGETQQPYQNLAHRERHPLKITAPSR